VESVGLKWRSKVARRGGRDRLAGVVSVQDLTLKRKELYRALKDSDAGSRMLSGKGCDR